MNAPAAASRIAALISALHGLYFYGAAAIAAFGWALGELLGGVALHWVPLWFAAALFIYNVDRSREEPADLLNVPLRTATLVRLRLASRVLATLAGLTLLLLPAVRRDGVTLALVVGAGLVCLNYTLPIGGFRLRELPLLKTLFAPSAVVAAIVVPPWLHGEILLQSPSLVVAALWAWCFLLFNTLLCDLRDVRGDRECGVISLAVYLGARRSGMVLAGLTVILSLLAITNAGLAPERWTSWLLLAGTCPVLLPILFVRALRDRSERFFEWWVEGVMFLPAVIVGLPI